MVMDLSDLLIAVIVTIVGIVFWYCVWRLFHDVRRIADALDPPKKPRTPQETD